MYFKIVYSKMYIVQLMNEAVRVSHFGYTTAMYVHENRKKVNV
jgi:hypothetical protein